MSEDIRNSFVYRSGAATIAYLAELPLGHPLDVLRTRLQADPRATIHSSDLYSGLRWSVIPAALRGGIRWGCHTFFCDTADRLFSQQITPASTVFVSAGTGITTGASLHIFRRIRVHVNIDEKTPIRVALKREGISWIFQGVRPAILRSISAATIYTAGYDTCRHLFTKHCNPTTPTVELRHAILFATVSGAASGLIKNPLALIEVTMQGSAQEQRITRMSKTLIAKHGLSYVLLRGSGVSMIRSSWYAAATTCVLWKLNAFPKRMTRW